MPRYFDRATRTAVDASTATYADGSVRPGFDTVLEDGERLHFSLPLMDSSPRLSTVYLTDGTVADAAKAEADAYQRSSASLNDWRKPPPAVTDLVRDAQAKECGVVASRADRVAFEDAKRKANDEIHNGWRRQSVPATA